MLIQKPSRFGRRNDASSNTSGFTLIELLVVVAIIAVLISILLPSLAAAREQARTAVCGEQLGGLGKGMHMYFTENSDWIPGVNTSGVELRGSVGSIPATYQSRMPVQSYDWMTPSIANSVQLPAVRAKKFKELLNRYKCPSQTQYQSVFFGLAQCQDSSEFSADPNGWTTLSYLMPVQFQFWGQRYSGQTIGMSRINPALALHAAVAPSNWEAYHQTYRSRISEVGTPADKVAAADGTRYLADPLLDFDISPNPGTSPSDPGLFGSFTSSGAWWGGDTSYGVRQSTRTWTGQSMSYNQPGNGKNLALSYRHGPKRGAESSGACQDNKGKINCMMFDGSTRLLGDYASRRISYWYPRGSAVHNVSEGMIQEMPNGWEIP